MRSTALLLLTLCGLTIVGVTQSKRAASEDTAMTAGDLQQICIGSSAESKAACRFYLLGITQGVSVGMSIADGKIQGGRPCIPDDLSASAIELAVKMKLGEDLMVFPDDRKLDASGFVGGILYSTFPCRKPH
ncbi:MAG: Rap1a/Tai family immunity protein [Terriglobales bacterium]